MIMWVDELACFAFCMLTLGTYGVSFEESGKYLEPTKEVTLDVIPLCYACRSKNICHLNLEKCHCLGLRTDYKVAPSNKNNKTKIFNCDFVLIACLVEIWCN
jgi:hypothetical protein